MAISRYDFGEVVYSHRGVSVNSTVGSIQQDRRITANNLLYDVGYIPAGFEHRPDLISNIFYNTPAYWWVILEVNNITDPFEGLNVGDRILIPKIS